MTRLILVGGFLGAGKTTLLLQAAKMLAARGLRTGFITNDQGSELVDTALAEQQQLPVVEVAGGCFCCRFPDLLEGLQYLQKTVQPDVILAEPVGSCTDLIATVVRPLRAYHANQFELAPLTVLLDSTRSLDAYSETVGYLYQKQLAEAEIIGLSKADLLEPAQVQATRQRYEKLYTPVQVHALSARAEKSSPDRDLSGKKTPDRSVGEAFGNGLTGWLDQVLNEQSRADQSLEIDYHRYTAAEAELGWLNSRGTVQSSEPFSAKNWLNHFLHLLDEALLQKQAAIAHLKMQVTTGDARFKASITQSGGAVSWDLLPSDVRGEQIDFVLNARVSSSSRVLEQIVRHTFAEMTPEPDFHYDFTHFECFSPLPPRPTYRLTG